MSTRREKLEYNRAYRLAASRLQAMFWAEFAALLVAAQKEVAEQARQGGWDEPRRPGPKRGAR